MINRLRTGSDRLLADARFSEILTGSVVALLARVLATAFGFVCTLWISRVYGAGVLGTVALINSVLMLATVFTVLGTGTSILRLIPEHLVKYSPTSAFGVYRRVHGMVVTAALLTGTVLYFSAGQIAARMFSKPDLASYLALAAPFVVFKSMMLVNTQAVRGLKLIRAFGALLLLPKASELVFLLVLFQMLGTMDVPIFALMGSYGLTGLLGWVIVHRAFRARTQPADRTVAVPIRRILSISLPMMMTTAMSFVIAETGVIVLGMFRSDAEVGYYAVATRLATLTAFLLTTINSIAGPTFSELYHSGDMDELFRVAKKATKLIFWTTAPILTGFLVFGRLALGMVFGHEFTVAYPALVLLVLGQFVHSISGATGLFMNMTGNQVVLRNIMFVSALMNVVLNWLLVPPMGFNGSALSAMVSLVAWNVSTLIFLKLRFDRTTGYFPWPSRLW